MTDMPVPLETEDTTQGVQDSDTAALNNRDENNNYVGPLCEEQKELDVFFAIGGANFSGAQTFTQQLIDSNPSYQKLSENTNIKINYIVPAVGEEAAQFNLLIASGNYPDIIVGNAGISYPGGMDQAVEDEKIRKKLKFDMMISKIHPHFIYNTLDSIKWNARINQVPEIAVLAENLAVILRKSISSRRISLFSTSNGS